MLYEDECLHRRNGLIGHPLAQPREGLRLHCIQLVVHCGGNRFPVKAQVIDMTTRHRLRNLDSRQSRPGDVPAEDLIQIPLAKFCFCHLSPFVPFVVGISTAQRTWQPPTTGGWFCRTTNRYVPRRVNS